MRHVITYKGYQYIRSVRTTLTKDGEKPLIFLTEKLEDAKVYSDSTELRNDYIDIENLIGEEQSVDLSVKDLDIVRNNL